MTDTIRSKLYTYLQKCYKARPGEWVNSGFLEKQIVEYSKLHPDKMFKPSTGSRRLRELANENLIDQFNFIDRGIIEI